MKRLLLAVLLLAPAGARADAVFENARMRLVIDNAGRCASLVEKGTGRELLAPAKLPAAVITLAGKIYPCSGASLDAGRLALRFAGVDTVLRVAVQSELEWILFRLEGIAGARPERLTLLQLPVAITANVGTRLDIAWDERTSVCLMAADWQAECRASRGAGAALLAAAGQDAPGPRLEGTATALIVAPTTGIRQVLRRASHAFGLPLNESPAGTPSKETEDARGAYWFLDVKQDDAPRVIEYCRQSGIRQVLISSGSWCASPGHYLFNTRSFPDGEAGLKRLVAALHAAGIKVSMHCFVSKVAKVDPYVSPRPDRRFWVDRRAALAGAVTAGQTEIRTASDLREWPGSPVAKQKVWEGGVAKHREVILDDEIVCYDAIGPEGKWDTFLGCKRGAWGTMPAAHAAGADARHYGVDGCINGYIIDQETDLLDEVAERIAGIFNRCDFDGVYFDGGEDVDTRRFNYYVSRFQDAAMKRFRKRPLIHMGTIMTHLLWHSFTRSATVDTYLNTLNGAIIAGAPVEKWPTVREHSDRSVAYMLSVRQDLMPGELGWFGIWPRGKNTDGLQLDEFEYLMAKSLAYDAPVSLQTSFRQMESHPLTPGLLEIFRVYDGLRMRRAVSAATREMLTRKGQDYALVGGEKMPQFVPVAPAPSVAGGKEARACVGETAGGALITLWHTAGDAELLLDFPPPAPRTRGERCPAPRTRGERCPAPRTRGERCPAPRTRGERCRRPRPGHRRPAAAGACGGRQAAGAHRHPPASALPAGRECQAGRSAAGRRAAPRQAAHPHPHRGGGLHPHRRRDGAGERAGHPRAGGVRRRDPPHWRRVARPAARVVLRIHGGYPPRRQVDPLGARALPQPGG